MRMWLQNSPCMRVVIAGTETGAWAAYNGKQRSMMIINTIFRLGGVAALLSNHPGDAGNAKYRLHHLMRTHMGASDMAYKCDASHSNVHEEQGKCLCQQGRIPCLSGLAVPVQRGRADGRPRGRRWHQNRQCA